MRPNIGRTNSFIRTMIGFSILSFATARMVKKPWKQSYVLLAVVGAMKVAEGLMNYCPLVALWEKRNSWMDDALRWKKEPSNDFYHSTEVGE